MAAPIRQFGRIIGTLSHSPVLSRPVFLEVSLQFKLHVPPYKIQRIRTCGRGRCHHSVAFYNDLEFRMKIMCCKILFPYPRRERVSVLNMRRIKSSVHVLSLVFSYLPSKIHPEGFSYLILKQDIQPCPD